MLRLLTIYLLLGLTFLSGSAAAKDCVRGKFLTLQRGPQSWHITEKQVHRLAQTKMVTSTYWAKSGTYAGPLLADVIELAGIQGKPKQLKVYTWDNFRSSLPYKDLEDYGVILATSLNGKKLEISDWGPLYIVYPYDEFAQLKTPAGLMKMAWQVCKIVIE